MKVIRLSKLLGLLLLFIAAATFFTACSGSDDPEPGPQLEGTWNATNIDYSGTSITQVGNATIAETAFTGTSISEDYQMAMNANGTYNGSGSYTIELKSDIGGQVITETQVVSGENAIGNGEWSRTGNTVIFTDVNGTQSEATIVELTESTLTFSISLQRTSVDENFGITTINDVDAVFSFAR